MTGRGFRAPVATGAVAVIPLLLAPVALPAKSHAFNATYTGTATGHVSGTSASGSATATGRGRLIGASTLRGSGHGVFTSQTCVEFSGKAVLKGAPGAIRLTVRGARACAAAAMSTIVSFSGTASVSGGTSTFAGARGTLTFTGTFAQGSGKLTLSFHGRLSYN